MEDFNWSRISLMFPEFIKEEAEIISKDYGPSPIFHNGHVNFLLKDSYGIQLFFNQEIPK